jgi:hypothetical protein
MDSLAKLGLHAALAMVILAASAIVLHEMHVLVRETGGIQPEWLRAIVMVLYMAVLGPSILIVDLVTVHKLVMPLVEAAAPTQADPGELVHGRFAAVIARRL